MDNTKLLHVEMCPNSRAVCKFVNELLNNGVSSPADILSIQDKGDHYVLFYFK